MTEKKRKKKSIVVIGGGTGLPVLLRGLKNHDVELTAVVTVADDGGSTGLIRDQMDLPAVGDIRNVIAAMSDVEPVLYQMFQHRFKTSSELNGHALGNLILAALCEIKGDFADGVQEMCQVLNVKGTVLPVANHSVILHALYEDGSVVQGESSIPKVNKRISRVWVTPTNIEANRDALEHIASADAIVIGPGSLYTSILPNLIFPQIADAVCSARGLKIYIGNVMTQFGETNGYTLSDHVTAIHDHVGERFLDYVIANNGKIPRPLLKRYEEEDAEPVKVCTDFQKDSKVKLIKENIVEFSDGSIRHNKKALAKIIIDLLQ